MAHEINKEDLIENYKSMINVLEYDSMRSPGKAKMNAGNLFYMYYLLEMHSKPVAKKPTTVGK